MAQAPSNTPETTPDPAALGVDNQTPLSVQAAQQDLIAIHFLSFHILNH